MKPAKQRGGGIPVGSLRRSIEQMTIGIQADAHRRQRNLRDTRSGQIEQQVHIPLSGDATSGWAYVDQQINWELPFLYAPMQQRVPFPTPHFHCGIELTSGTEDLVDVRAQLIAWTVNDAGWFVGATVRLSSCAPNAGIADVAYEGVAHLSFTGFAAMAEGTELTGA